MHQRRHGDLPTIAELANLELRLDLGIGEKHLIERRMSVHLPKGLDANAILLDVEHEIAQPAMLRHIPIRSGKEQAELRMVSARRPPLLSVAGLPALGCPEYKNAPRWAALKTKTKHTGLP